MTSGPLGGGPLWPGGDADEPDANGEPPASGGWIPPDARPWRHPSELAFPGRPAPALEGHRAPRRSGARVVSTAAAAAGAAAAVALGLSLLIANAGTPPGEVASLTVSTAAVTPCCRLTPAEAGTALELVVALQRQAGDTVGYGVLMGGGGLVATTADALDGMRTLRALAPSGAATTATLVAKDATSGVALLRLDRSLGNPPPAGAPADDLWAGSPAMTLSMGADGRTPVWRAATVDSPHAEQSSGPWAGMAMISVAGDPGPTAPGEPLVDASGAVVGILCQSGPDQRVFLPIDLVEGVGGDLEMYGSVHHGWLDVSDAAVPDGALVLGVGAGGAATGLLEPGDVIVGVDGSAVWSPAELRSLLYARQPGTRVTLEVERRGQLGNVAVALSAAP